jgi:hypothetical protein
VLTPTHGPTLRGCGTSRSSTPNCGCCWRSAAWLDMLARGAGSNPAVARQLGGSLAATTTVTGSCAHPPLVPVAVKTYARYARDEASLQNDGQSWELFDV